MLKKNSSKLIFFFLLLVFLLGANFVLALEVTYPDLPGVDPPQEFLQKIDQGLIPGEQTLSLYAQYFYNLALWIAGAIALGFLIYGGIRYLTSSGKPEVMASAKNQLTAVFFGLLLLFSSYLIFTALNPELAVFQTLSLEPIEIPEKPKAPLPPTEKIKTSIDFQMPFGRIVEKIFETYISDYPEPNSKPEPRITRIENNAETIKKLTDNLEQQSEDLTNYAHRCTCRSTGPENPCGGNVSGDTTWKCDCGGCSAVLPCTCDPCEKVRGDIQGAEQKNLENVYLGIEITEKDVDDQEYTITTSLIKEQEKTEEEVRLLKEQLDRLKRAEKFIEECPWRVLISYAEFLAKKDSFSVQEETLREIKFWDDVNVIYIDKWTKEPDPDWATFDCAISGTLEQEYPFPAPGEDGFDKDKSVEEIESVVSGTTACSDEAPVGEIIDRTKRVTQLLINKMETLVEKDKELIDAVDTLEVLVSQCSSKRGCERRCTCFGCLCSHHHHCIPGCKGWIYCCADSSGPYPSECKDRDEDTPCPYEEIDAQLEEIQRIHQEITDLIEGKGENKTPEEIGVLPIINEIVPEILDDLEIFIRRPMQKCTSEAWEERDTVLYNCFQVRNATIPEGKVIDECCPTEYWQEGEKKQTPFGDCFEECYLEKGQEKHRECLQECLERKSVELNDEALPYCVHRLNFYCCHQE